MSGIILRLTTSQCPVFLLNSRLDLFSATAIARRRPFSQSYRTILPSSLAAIHSSTLGFSPQLPVSVYGTVCLFGFSWKFLRFTPRFRRIVVLSLKVIRAIPSARENSETPLPFNISRYGNINPFRIRFAFRLLLSPRLTLIRLALFRKP